MKHTSTKLLLLSIAFAASACGSDDADNPNPTSQPSDTYKALSRLFCEHAVACRAGHEDAIPWTSADNCAAAQEAAFPFYQQIDASVTAGRITWNDAHAAQCLATATANSEDLTCEQFWANGADEMFVLENLDGVCAALGQGLVPPGQACTFDFDCTGEDYCGDGDICIADGGGA